MAGVAQTSASSATETLTFSGALFGSDTVNLTLGAGNTLQDTINQINNDPRLRNRVVASQENGKLVIRAVNHGSASNFTVVSDLAAASDNSGIGTTPINAEGLMCKAQSTAKPPQDAGSSSQATTTTRTLRGCKSA